MSKRNRQLRWVFPMWEVASMSSHQTLQRGLASSDPSTLEMLPADLEDRLSYLDRLLVAYGMSIELASEIHKPELKAFRVAVAGIKRELNEIRSLYMSGGTARS